MQSCSRQISDIRKTSQITTTKDPNPKATERTSKKKIQKAKKKKNKTESQEPVAVCIFFLLLPQNPPEICHSSEKPKKNKIKSKKKQSSGPRSLSSFYVIYLLAQLNCFGVDPTWWSGSSSLHEEHLLSHSQSAMRFLWLDWHFMSPPWTSICRRRQVQKKRK